MVLSQMGETCGSKCNDSVDHGATADAMVYVLYVLAFFEVIGCGYLWYKHRMQASEPTFGE